MSLPDVSSTPPPPPPAPASGNRTAAAARRRQIQNWVVIAIVLISGLVYLAHSRRVAEQSSPGGDADAGLLGGGPIAGKVAPDWTLQNPDGGMVSLSQFQGHPVVMDFWATWCAPCQIEIPWWRELQNQYRSQGLVIIGVSEDDSSGDVRKYLQSHTLNYPIVLDLNHIPAGYGTPDGLPTTLFLRRDGTIAARVIGLADKSELDRNVRTILQ